MFSSNVLCSQIKDALSLALFVIQTLLTNVALFSKESLNTNQNMTILNATMKFILSTKRFAKSLFNLLITTEIN